MSSDARVQQTLPTNSAPGSLGEELPGADTRWYPIPGFPRHEVNRDGSIRSWARGSARILVCAVGSNGYRMVNLRDGGQRRNRTVHSIVAEVFLGPRPDGQQVRHLDGDPLNNALTNLAYGTPSDNTLDSVLHGTHNHASQSCCKRGHEFTPENTRTGPKGDRVCVQCHRIRNANYRARRAA